MEESPPPPDQNDAIGYLAVGMKYAGVAMQFAVTLGLLGYLGYRIDERYDSDPWGVLSGILLGMGIGLWSMLRQIEKLDRMK